MARKVLRELIILRKFSQIKSNVFTSKITQLILPNDSSKLTHLFIVMEYVEMDLKKILEQHTKSMD